VIPKTAKMCFPKKSNTKLIITTEMVTLTAKARRSFCVASLVTVKNTLKTKKGVIIKNIFKKVAIKNSK
jgi:hypothetical protein